MRQNDVSMYLMLIVLLAFSALSFLAGYVEGHNKVILDLYGAQGR